MKKILLASACFFALATPTAFAQTAQPSPGASSQGNVGPGASEGAMKDGAMKQGTTCTSSRPSAGGDASTSGAGTAARANGAGHGQRTRRRTEGREQAVRLRTYRRQGPRPFALTAIPESFSLS